MRTILTVLVGVILLLGGCQTVPVKPCVCPPEDVYVNTEAGIMKFEKGEFDQPQTYIINQQQMDEILKLYEKEALKMQGGAS